MSPFYTELISPHQRRGTFPPRGAFILFSYSVKGLEAPRKVAQFLSMFFLGLCFWLSSFYICFTPVLFFCFFPWCTCSSLTSTPVFHFVHRSVNIISPDVGGLCRVFKELPGAPRLACLKDVHLFTKDFANRQTSSSKYKTIQSFRDNFMRKLYIYCSFNLHKESATN